VFIIMGVPFVLFVILFIAITGNNLPHVKRLAII
jgi:hypothetical protein